MAPQLETSMQTLDQATQQIIIAAADAWAQERYGAPADKVNLLNTDTTAQGTAYDIEVSAGGALDQLHLISQPNGEVDIRTENENPSA
jgi:hypothetical protein